MTTEVEYIDMQNRINDLETSVHANLRELSEKLDNQQDVLMQAQTINTKAICDLTHHVSGVVEVHATVLILARFIKWFAGIGLSLAAIWFWFNER